MNVEWFQPNVRISARILGRGRVSNGGGPAAVPEYPNDAVQA